MPPFRHEAISWRVAGAESARVFLTLMGSWDKLYGEGKEVGG